MKIFIIEEAKKHTWRLLIPAGILLSLTGVLAILGIPILIMGIRDLLPRIRQSKFGIFLWKLSKAIFYLALILGVPYLIVTNFLFFLGLLLFIILVIGMVFLVKVASEYGKLPKNLL